jgi:hypothetical protein
MPSDVSSEQCICPAGRRRRGVTSIQELWWQLGSSLPALDGGWHSRRIHPSAPVAIYAAVASGTALPGLLIETAAAVIPLLEEYPSGRGFTVRAISLHPGRDGTRLELSLSEPAYRDVFEVLAEDVAGAIAAAGTQSIAVHNFLARLRVWQEFMRRRSPEGLNRDEQVGLLSELQVLETVLLAVLPASDAVSAWRGHIEACTTLCCPHATLRLKGPLSFQPRASEYPDWPNLTKHWRTRSYCALHVERGGCHGHDTP